ncbi:hypothetical protein ABIC89_002794 [Variovorax boronicumulans]|uniref:hypothetical protein n=1 Tax=Variovorax boronicumulans TaxID=436515 RepID=UPI003390CC12
MSSPRTAVFVDHNVWDPVFLRGIDLRSEFPVERYGLAITREGQFEIPLTPEPLRTFIEQSMKRWEVGVDVKFGFWDARHVQEDQRVGGFGFGVWASNEVAGFYAAQRSRLRDPKRKTRLYKNEADIALGARSFEGIVLTLDSKPGPLRDAYQTGGRVVFLDQLPRSSDRLGPAVENVLAARFPGAPSELGTAAAQMVRPP